MRRDIWCSSPWWGCPQAALTLPHPLTLGLTKGVSLLVAAPICAISESSKRSMRWPRRGDGGTKREMVINPLWVGLLKVINNKRHANSLGPAPLGTLKDRAPPIARLRSMLLRVSEMETSHQEDWFFFHSQRWHSSFPTSELWAQLPLPCSKSSPVSLILRRA